MRRNASMSGSASTQSNSNPRGFTRPSLSASLLPWVRVTVLSFRSAMPALFLSAAFASEAGGGGERGFHPCGRKVALDDFLHALEDLEMMSRSVGSPKGHRGLHGRESRQRRRGLRDEHHIILEEAEALSGPLLYALHRIQVSRSFRGRAEPGSGAACVGPEAHASS